MMELLDVVIRLGNAREVSRPKIPNGKRPFKKSFGDGKNKLSKRKYEPNEKDEGESVGKPTTLEGYVNWAK
jgi:hypothetical protein